MTIDSQMEYYNADRPSNAFVQRCTAGDIVVVELKYRPEHDALATRAAARFPFRASRSSKYVQGVEYVLY